MKKIIQYDIYFLDISYKCIIGYLLRQKSTKMTENTKISLNSAFYSQNENTELMEFLEKVNSGQKNIFRMTSFSVKFFMKSFNF